MICTPEDEASCRPLAEHYECDLRVDRYAPKGNIYILNPSALKSEPMDDGWMFTDFLS